MYRILFFVFVALWPSIAVADDDSATIVEMIKDLGGHDSQQKNNGKVLKCEDEGTKKVSITKYKSFTSYIGDYSDCRENGKLRDGIFEIHVKGDEILESTSKSSINSQLFTASGSGDLKKVRKLIRRKANVNHDDMISGGDGKYISKWTTLMSAVIGRNLDVVKLLVKNGARVNAVNSDGMSAVWIAANIGRIDIVDFLVRKGADISVKSSENITPLMTAAMNGSRDVVKYLLKRKAEVDSRHRDGDTALMFSIARGHTDIARLLIDAGADVNVQNRAGVTPLIIAAAEGNVAAVKALLDKKADVTLAAEDGKTAVDIAIARGNTEIVDLLKEAKPAPESMGSR